MSRCVGVFLTTLCLGTLTWAQDNLGPKFGLSVYQGVSTLDNATETAQRDLYNSVLGYPGEDKIQPRRPWYTNSMSFDTYLLNDRLSVSVGLRFVHIKTVQDSILTTYYDTPYYGQKKLWLSYGMPFIKLGYYHHFSDQFALSYTASIGVVSVIDRYKSYGTPYDPAGQSTWDYQNKTYDKFNYDFDVDTKGISAEAEVLSVYSVGSFDFKVGPSFSYFQNNWITGYYGLFFKAGVSWRFKKR